MNFSQLCDAVYILTGRPDLVPDTQLAVQRATTKLHLLDQWKRDREERAVTFPTASSVALDIPTQFTRWRKFETLAPFDPVSGQVLPCYDQISDDPRSLIRISPDNLFDRYWQSKVDVYYESGTQLNIRFASGQSGLYASWWKFPVIDVNGFNSWIADNYPFAIIDEAAGHILTITGSVDEGNKYLDPMKGTVYNPINGHLAMIRQHEL